jgi:hypothetical protein
MQPLKQIIVFSDIHCGCRSGLCPPSFQLDGGGVYTASKLQKKVWAYWNQFWDEWVPRVTRGEPYGVVFNGDCVDGRGPNARNVNSLVSANLSDQIKIAYECIAPKVKDACVLYFVRGTEVHDGASGETSEQLARMLGAKPDAAGNHSRWELRLEINKRLIDIQHHISPVSTTAYEASAPQKELDIACSEAGRWGDRPPDVIVRSHRHRCIETRTPNAKGNAISITTPGWQLKTPYTHRLPGARQSMPQFGGICIRSGDEEVFARTFVRTIKRSVVDVPTVSGGG